jgi:deoxyadenosine/deoxycytidine kinase
MVRLGARVRLASGYPLHHALASRRVVPLLSLSQQTQATSIFMRLILDTCILGTRAAEGSDTKNAIPKIKNMSVKHIAVAGNIGAGKTTLCELLGQQFAWDINYESTDDNPYLADFYEDMKRWSFNLQVYFLNNRYRQILDIQSGDKVVIQDRSIYEDAHIFAPNLHQMGLMEERDFKNYFDLFKLMTSHIRPPDLLIYLQSDISTLVKHIHKRGRDYESNMSINYLKKLNERYENWISNYKEGNLLILDVNKLDYRDNEADKIFVVEQVRAALGL